MWTVKGIYPAVSITSAYTTKAGQSSCITMKHITGPFTDSCNGLHVWISVMGKRFVTRNKTKVGWRCVDNVLVMSRVLASASTLFLLIPFTFNCICICLLSCYVY